jgi:hypothetical protein
VVSLTREGGVEMNETNKVNLYKKVNLDRVYAKALVEGWDKAIDLARGGLPFCDKEIEEDLLAMKAISQRLHTPRTPKITLAHEDSPIQVGRYDRCSCYEYFSRPELGILAPDPDCEVCGGTGEVFIPSSKERFYFMGIDLREAWPGGVSVLEMYSIMEVSLLEEMDKEYVEMKNEWNRELVQLYRENRKEGMDPETAWEKAWNRALNEDGESDKSDDEEGLAFLP